MEKTKDWKHVKMLKEVSCWSEKEDLRFEVPYNYFGNSGFVDLIIKSSEFWSKRPMNIYYEIKTEIVDLGEMLRQFKKMQKYAPKSIGETQVNRFILILPFKRDIYDFLIENEYFFFGMSVKLMTFYIKRKVLSYIHFVPGQEEFSTFDEWRKDYLEYDFKTDYIKIQKLKYNQVNTFTTWGR